jgi:hypothetical protein
MIVFVHFNPNFPRCCIDVGIDQSLMHWLRELDPDFIATINSTYLSLIYIIAYIIAIGMCCQQSMYTPTYNMHIHTALIMHFSSQVISNYISCSYFLSLSCLIVRYASTVCIIWILKVWKRFTRYHPHHGGVIIIMTLHCVHN